MDVLDDPTRVGWYKNGTVPGERGSAIIGAHVFSGIRQTGRDEVGRRYLY